jgi:hypothetical protein
MTFNVNIIVLIRKIMDFILYQRVTRILNYVRIYIKSKGSEYVFLIKKYIINVRYSKTINNGLFFMLFVYI